MVVTTAVWTTSKSLKISDRLLPTGSGGMASCLPLPLQLLKPSPSSTRTISEDDAAGGGF